MSIFKDQHRDARTFWAWLLGLLLGQKCRSWLQPPYGPPNPQVRHNCTLRRGHPKKHDNGKGLRWGYGDNWLEGN